MFKVENITLAKDEIYSKVVELISDYLRLEKDELKGDSHIINDMGADSLALVELGFKLSETFDIPMLEPTEDAMVINNLVDIIAEVIKKGRC